MSSERGMFDPDDDVLPQGIFDVSIFDTTLVEPLIDNVIIPAFLHSTSIITALLASKEIITIK